MSRWCWKRSLAYLRLLLSGGLLFFCVAPAGGAQLELLDGVEVRFADDAALVVRDKFRVAGGQVTFTSVRDPGAVGTAARAPGVWSGVRVERSADVLRLDGLRVSYAGGGEAAALYLRRGGLQLRDMEFSSNRVGLRVDVEGVVRLSRVQARWNRTALEVLSGQVEVSRSVFQGNTAYAVRAVELSRSVQAQRNWWGDRSGPRVLGGDANGLGDPVSTGVVYGDWLSSAPLLRPLLRLAAPAPYYERSSSGVLQVALELSCAQATDYRLAEGDAFAG